MMFIRIEYLCLNIFLSIYQMISIATERSFLIELLYQCLCPVWYVEPLLVININIKNKQEFMQLMSLSDRDDPSVCFLCFLYWCMFSVFQCGLMFCSICKSKWHAEASCDNAVKSGRKQSEG